MNIHEKAERELKYHEEANRLMEGGGCWIAEDNATGECLGKKSANGAYDCKICPAYNCFYQVAEGYASEEGITWAEAIWLAKQFFDIPSRFMCNGKDGEWMKGYTPAQYNECLKRQAILLGEALEEKTPEKSAEVLTGQMTIDEYLKGVSDG